MLLPVIFVVVQNLHNDHHHGGSIFATQITQSGLATPVLMLKFQAYFMLPLIAALVAGDIVAAEDGNGTLKTILTRSVDRGQVLAAKTLAALTYGAVAVFLSAAVATIAGVASWGFHPIATLSGSVVSASEGLLLVFAANACYLIPLLAVGASVCCYRPRPATARRPWSARSALSILLYIVGGSRALKASSRIYSPNSSRAGTACCAPRPTGRRSPTRPGSARYSGPGAVRRIPVFLRRDVAGG